METHPHSETEIFDCDLTYILIKPRNCMDLFTYSSEQVPVYQCKTAYGCLKHVVVVVVVVVVSHTSESCAS